MEEWKRILSGAQQSRHADVSPFNLRLSRQRILMAR
jgi:hypothetical protein